MRSGTVRRVWTGDAGDGAVDDRTEAVGADADRAVDRVGIHVISLAIARTITSLRVIAFTFRWTCFCIPADVGGKGGHL